MLNICGHYTGGGSSSDKCWKCDKNIPPDVVMKDLFKRMKEDQDKTHKEWLQKRMKLQQETCKHENSRRFGSSSKFMINTLICDDCELVYEDSKEPKKVSAVSVYGCLGEELELKDLRIANRAMSMDSFPASKTWKSADWAMAITGELGELCNMFKKRAHGKDIPQRDIEHEFADILIYLEKWADREGIDLAKATRRKFNIVAKRVGSKAKL